jgi:hypothetical protein
MSFDPRIKASISYKNRRGLPAVFNSRIVEENRGKILAFTHDDVRFDDYWLSAGSMKAAGIRCHWSADVGGGIQTKRRGLSPLSACGT